MLISEFWRWWKSDFVSFGQSQTSVPRFMYLYEANWLLAVALYLPDMRVVCSDVSQQETKQEHFPTSKYMNQHLSCMSYTHSI